MLSWKRKLLMNFSYLFILCKNELKKWQRAVKKIEKVEIWSQFNVFEWKANNLKLIGTVRANFYYCYFFIQHLYTINFYLENEHLSIKAKLSSNLKKFVVNEMNKHKNINFVILFASILMAKEHDSKLCIYLRRF